MIKRILGLFLVMSFVLVIIYFIILNKFGIIVWTNYYGPYKRVSIEFGVNPGKVAFIERDITRIRIVPKSPVKRFSPKKLRI